MKNTAKRLLSLLLVFCVLTSCIVFIPAVSVSAATSGSSNAGTVTKVLMNNNFDNGEQLVGAPVNGAADYVSNAGEYLSFSSSAPTTSYLSFNLAPYAPESGTMVIQFDVMFSSMSTTSTTLATLVNNSGSQTLLTAKYTNAIFTTYSRIYAFGSSNSYKTANTSNWYTVAFELVFTSKSNYTVNAYYCEKNGTLASFGSAVTVSSPLSELRFNLGTNNWNLDNLMIFTTSATSKGSSYNLTIDSNDKGVLYNEKAGQFSVNDMQSLDHPYLFANQSKFNALSDVYNNPESNPELYSYINYQVTQAANIYGSYNGSLATKVTNTNTDTSNNGYDVGGRLGTAANHTENIQTLAFAYQMTRDTKYAQLAYDYAIQMGTWEHWGPGHFLNAADAMAPFAIAYDWLYDAWVALNLNVSAIESILFTHGLLPAYYSAANGGLPTAWVSPKVTSGGNYTNRTNNWNTVCNSGVTIASLALMGVTTSADGTKIDNTFDGTYDASTEYNTTSKIIAAWGSTTGSKAPTVISNGTYQDYAEYLINVALASVPALGLGQYVPDGSYIESNGYWSYGTNTLYEMIAALISATGSDWELLSQPGIKNTAYFALNTQSGGGQSWNYHDSDTTGPADTYWFQFLGSAAVYGDIDLAGIRKHFLSTIPNLRSSVWDIIYYMSDEEIGDWVFPDLEYYAEGVDGYVVRDGWDLDSSYAAFMGNTNNLGHGQIDSGSFVYYNKGVKWFGDLGTENYNVKEFWGDENSDGIGRYNYYKMGGEGNNDLIVTGNSSLPYGQALDGFGYLTSHGSNAYGAYAILDNTSVYGTLASSAKRGMLMTNDRRTVVIQDEVTFTSSQSVAWIAHTEQNVILSLDGRVAYLVNGDNAIKVTLVSADTSLKFEILGVGGGSNKLLTGTLDDNYSESNGGVAQDDLTGWQRLVIRSTGITFNVAVVIEEVPFGEDAEAFGSAYTWEDMASWVPAADGRYSSDGSGDGDGGDTPSTPEQAPAVIATVTVGTYANAPEDAEDDTPIVDLFSGSVSSLADSSDWGEITYTSYDAGSFAELASIVNAQSSTAIISIDLKWTNNTPITLNRRCTVALNGYSLNVKSNNYIASVSGDTLTLDKGEVTVRWHIDGQVISEVYTSSGVATYTGAINAGIKEEDLGNNTYAYYTSAWASTEGGTALSDNEMIVTSSNCDFYLVNKPYDGYYVTVKDGVVTGYTGANAVKDFFSTVIRGQYDRISITKSFEYDSTGIEDSNYISNNVNLYFNGNTITYNTADVSDHMFSVGGGTFTMYGHGGIINNAPQANIFMQNGKCELYAYDVDFNSHHAVIDQRSGRSYFYGCDVYIQTNATAFGVINRNNVNVTEDTMPYLIVSGCTIDMPASTGKNAVFSIRSNAKLEVRDGTVVTVGSGTYLFVLYNSTVGLNNNEDVAVKYNYEAYSDMYARLGEVYHNCEYLVNAETDIATNTQNEQYLKNESKLQTYIDTMLAEMKTRIYYTDGAKFTEAPAQEVIDNHVDEGYVIAQQNSLTYPYVVALKANTATVNWYDKEGAISLTQTWLAGELPEAPALTNTDTVKYFYTGIDVVEGGEAYDFKIAETNNFTVYMNLSLQSDFNVNFFIEKSDAEAAGISKFIVNGEEVLIGDATTNGTRYKLSVTNIAPAESSGNFTLVIGFENGNTLTIAYSIAKYAEQVIKTDSSSGDEVEKLMVNLLKYMEHAHVYAGTNNSAGYEDVSAMLDQYFSYAGVAVVDREKADTEAVNDAIESAQLFLDSSLSYRFNLKAGYTGTVIFKSGDTEILTLNVVDGKHGDGEYDYVNIGRKAYDMRDGITIVTEKGEMTYTLANYYTEQVTEQGDLTSLLNSLCAYCECAEAYQATKK